MIEEDEYDDDFLEEEEFTPPTPQRAKQSVDKVLGVRTTVRKSKKTPEDKKREAFCTMIHKYEQAYTRGKIVSDFLDMEDWDDTWMDIIDELLELIYTPRQILLIQYFVFDRMDPETGETVPYEISRDKWVYLESPEQLFELLKTIK